MELISYDKYGLSDLKILIRSTYKDYLKVKNNPFQNKSTVGMLETYKRVYKHYYERYKKQGGKQTLKEIVSGVK